MFLRPVLVLFLKFMLWTLISSSFAALKNWDNPQERQEVIKRTTRILKCYVASLEDFTEECRRTLKSCPSPSLLKRIIFCEEDIQRLEGGLARTKAFAKEFTNLKNKSIKELENYFRHILLGRSQNLKDRRNVILEAFEAPEEETCAWGPTHPGLLDKLIPGEELFAILEIDRYQIMNQIILDLASFFDLREISPPCKMAIAASPALWALLQGLEDDLGHPDTAILTYPEKARFYNATDLPHEREKARSFLQDGDVVRYETYLEESQFIEMYSHTSFHREKRTFSMTPYDLQFETPDYKKKHPPLEWPDFLKKPLKLEPAPERTPEHPCELEDRASTLKPPLLADAEPALLSTFNEQTPCIHPNPPSDKSDTSSQKASSIDLGQRKSPKDTPPQQELSPKSVPILPIPEPVAPQLKGKVMTIHQRIFSPKNWKNLSFKDFRTLWEYLGGQITGYKSGGSHRALKFKGKTIGGTFVPHGSSCYGPRSLKYLREALEHIGWGSAAVMTECNT